MYVNDIGKETQSTIKLFADDCVLYRRIQSQKDCDLLQGDLNQLTAWSDDWLMQFNIRKCNTMTITRKKTTIKPPTPYHIRGTALQPVTEASYLGVTFTTNLTWKKHINCVASKASNVLAFVRRNLSHCKQSIKEKAYITLVRPLLEYASAVWDPYTLTNVSALDKVQRRAARVVKGVFSYQESVTGLLKDLGWPSLTTRRKNSRLVHLYKAITEGSALQIPSRVRQSTRNAEQFIPPHTNTDYNRYSFYPRTIKDWNALSKHTFKDLADFKTMLAL
jgi:hypothetical protein